MGITAEKQVYEAILLDEEAQKIYGVSKIFQGYAAPNSLASLSEYLYITRVSDVSLDRNLDTPGDTLRRVRLQIDVCDVNYGRMVERSKIIRRVLKQSFPSCIDGSTKGVVSSGDVVWNVTSIDIILFEED